MTYGEVANTVNPLSNSPTVEVSNNDESSPSITRSLQGYLPMRFNKR